MASQVYYPVPDKIIMKTETQLLHEMQNLQMIPHICYTKSTCGMCVLKILQGLFTGSRDFTAFLNSGKVSTALMA